ncbi:hypothetical protein GH714_035212 [Hevea brasiliensis]|uniref:Vacuolar import/degradation Vid27 C-terminal domain-containing protein n=1 Tax=Hevea brasiliensis TaxID=3981 RepID=A0A6A6N9D5_HEVBR|nr:hypothetical protein GH714_035212 [Hevea brasiliensis]
MWEDAEGDTASGKSTPVRVNQDLIEEFEEAANGGVQSLTLGALNNSFLVNDLGVQVYRNYRKGIHGKGICVKFDDRSGTISEQSTPKKAMLMRAETNMMLMSPLKEGKPHSTGIQQLDIETGKIVTGWKFGKDGTEITMRDITNDTKGSQLDPSESTFLGLDDNRLCQWDIRDKKGIVQSIGGESPVCIGVRASVLKRTNFQCFASTGDGSIVVGHLMARLDTYLVLICTLFTDKDGKTKTGFSGRMGNKIPAPRVEADSSGFTLGWCE